MSQITWGILIVVGVLAISGCSTLPKHAEPKVRIIDGGAEISDGISYRKLKRTDFKGKQPPQGFDKRMAAVTCVYTKPTIDKQAIEVQLDQTTQLLNVTFNNVQYRALMSRNCSWWNPDTIDSMEDYVLEHEQIHFALSEIAARRWSKAHPIQFQVKAGSQEIIAQNLKKQFQRQFEEKMGELQARNLKFDEDTSHGNIPERHEEWLSLVRSELATSVEPQSTASKLECEMSESAHSSIIAATRALKSIGNHPEAFELIQQAKKAAVAPECDSVRAKILADKAVWLVEDNDD